MLVPQGAGLQRKRASERPVASHQPAMARSPQSTKPHVSMWRMYLSSVNLTKVVFYEEGLLGEAQWEGSRIRAASKREGCTLDLGHLVLGNEGRRVRDLLRF